MIYQTNAQIKVLNEIGFSTEKEMQKFCETNLDMLLGLTFVTTEFKVAQFRFDSVAYCNAYGWICKMGFKSCTVFGPYMRFVATELQRNVFVLV